LQSVIASSVEVNCLNAEVSMKFNAQNRCNLIILYTQVLDLLYLLVKYGYYAAIDDINALIVPLVSLLNGMNDKLFPNATTEENNLFTMVRLLISSQYIILL